MKKNKLFIKNKIMITKELLNEISDKALKVALIKSQYSEIDFSNINIDEDGLTVVFSIGCHGYYEDEWVAVKLEDLNKTEEELKNEHELEVKRTAELLLKEMKKKREVERITKEKKEKEDYSLYLKLKDKFENHV